MKFPNKVRHGYGFLRPEKNVRLMLHANPNNQFMVTSR